MSNLHLASALIDKLGHLSSSLSTGDNDAVRNEALHLARKLVASLGRPENVAVDLAFSPFITVAARIAINLDLFKLIAQCKGSMGSTDLATQSGGEELLIIRVLRPLACVGFVEECGQRRWQATSVTYAMATNEIAAGHRMIGELIVEAAQKAPQYLQQRGRRCPTDPRDGLVQFAFDTKLTTFELLNSKPELLKDFNLFMGNTMGAREYWVDWFPVPSQLLDGSTDESALIVDVGAGKGHDLLAFHDKYPGRGQLILQDLDFVTAGVRDVDPAIEVMTYDFFTEQPVKGAKAYFYHHILHDWSDSYCLEILANAKRAMKPGYSKLLIHEMVVPEQGASTFHAMLDMTMMAFNAGMERTERQWRELLDKAGLEVVKVWLPVQDDADGIVEAVVKE